MATELDSRFWVQDESNTQRFLNLVGSVLSQVNGDEKCAQFSISRNSPGNKEYEAEDKLTLSQLTDLIKRIRDDEEVKYTTYVSLECWRFIKNEPKKESIMLTISSWGNKYGQSIGFNHSLEGDAQISILSVGPYCAILEESENVKTINEKVEENISTYLNLLQNIIQAISPLKALVYSDAGDYLLCNAHLAYFKNHVALNDSVNSLVNILTLGDPTNEIPSIEGHNSKEKSWMLHSWRTIESRELLQSKLINLIDNKNIAISQEFLQEFLQSGEYDYFDKNESFIVLNYPYFMNAFIDDFILDIANS